MATVAVSPSTAPIEPWWYTAEQIAWTVPGVLHDAGYPRPTTGVPAVDANPPGTAEGVRWLREGVNFLRDAVEHDDLERCLAEPTTTIDTRWDTFIAAAIRYRLRTLGVPAHVIPAWTYKPPLDRMWIIGSARASRAASAINLAPTELRRVGIYVPESVFDYQDAAVNQRLREGTCRASPHRAGQP